MKTILKSALIPCLMLGNTPAHAQAYTSWERLYLTLNGGQAGSDMGLEETRSDFARAGITNTVISKVDSKRFGYGVGVGYDLTNAWAIELSYLDLGQVELTFSSTIAINNLDEAHPESGDGFTLAGVYRHHLSPRSNLRARAGVFSWDAEYDTTTGNGSLSGIDRDSGTDMFWGVGFGHELVKDFAITGELQNFDFERDKTTYVQLGFEWRCLLR